MAAANGTARGHRAQGLGGIDVCPNLGGAGRVGEHGGIALSLRIECIARQVDRGGDPMSDPIEHLERE
jgi:hypothetical protein